MKRARLSLDLDSVTRQTLDAICAENGEESITSVIKKSVRLFDFVKQSERRGATLLIREKDGNEQRVILL